MRQKIDYGEAYCRRAVFDRPRLFVDLARKGPNGSIEPLKEATGYEGESFLTCPWAGLRAPPQQVKGLDVKNHSNG